MRLTIDSDVLGYAFIEPTKEVYKERFEEFAALHDKDACLVHPYALGRHIEKNLSSKWNLHCWKLR